MLKRFCWHFNNFLKISLDSLNFLFKILTETPRLEKRQFQFHLEKKQNIRKHSILDEHMHFRILQQRQPRR